jgi:quinol monooxygenase YgiN
MKLIPMLLVPMMIVAAAPAFADSDHDDEIAVLTYLKLKPGTQATFKAALERIVKPTLAEPGNIAWYVQESVSDPTSIVFYTRWKSELALQLHLKSKPLVDYIAETAPLLELGYPQIVRFHPIDQLRHENLFPPGCEDCSCCP